MISGISSYNNRNYNHRSPLNKDNKVAFGQLWRSFRTITDTSGNAVKLQHDTYLCRPRVIPKISKLPDLLQKRFPEGASVIVHAVSNGEGG